MSEKKSSSSTQELAAELERLEHAKKIVIDVLDKGILGLNEVGRLAIDLADVAPDGRCGCKGDCGCWKVCGGCQKTCQGIREVIDEVVQPGGG